MEIQLLEVRLTAASNHQSALLQWLTGLGKSSELQAAGRRFTLSRHSVNAPPQAVTTGKLASLSLHPLPPCHQSLTPLSIFIVFFTNHTSPWDTRPEILPCMKKKQQQGRRGQVSWKLLRERMQGQGETEVRRWMLTLSARSKTNVVHHFL